MAGWKIAYKWMFLARKITYFYDPFSSMPCLMTPLGTTSLESWFISGKSSPFMAALFGFVNCFNLPISWIYYSWLYICTIDYMIWYTLQIYDIPWNLKPTFQHVTAEAAALARQRALLAGGTGRTWLCERFNLWKEAPQWHHFSGLKVAIPVNQDVTSGYIKIDM